MLRSIQRFEVIATLGTGGNGTVYRARDPQLGREVAIKVLAGAAPRSELATRQTLDLRTPGNLLQEARVMAGVSHPNVVPVYEVGVADGEVYLVMELVEGCDLRAWCEEARTTDAILGVLGQAARGLAAAHARGVLHRDIKPDNILIGVDGRVRVADFGLSRIVDDATERSAIGGTPRYMAPELFAGGAATMQSDVFALCRTIVEAVCGGENVADDAVAEALRSRGVAARIRSVVARGLADAPGDRPALAEIIAALDPPVRSRRWLPAAIGAAVLGSGLVAFVATRDDPSTGCEPFTAWSAGRWDAAIRDRLVAAGPRTSTSQVVASLDAGAAAIGQAHAQACRAGRSLEDACLRRETFLLGAAARRAVSIVGNSPLRAAQIVQPRPLDGCRDVTAPPPRAELANIIALHDELVLGLERPAAEQLVIAARVERAADTLGESQLAILAALALGDAAVAADRVDDADPAYQRAHKGALAIADHERVALALLGRSDVALRTGDLAGGQTLARLALELGERPAMPARTRVRIYTAVGRAEIWRGNYAGALPRLEQALALARDQPHAEDLELRTRIQLVEAMRRLENRRGDAITLARDTLAFVRRTVGEHHLDHAVALNTLADALNDAREAAASLPYRRQALAVLIELLPPEHSRIARQRNALAAALLSTGEVAAARDEFAALLARSEGGGPLASSHAMFLGNTGIATAEAGDPIAGLRMLERAIDEYVAQEGKQSAAVLEARAAVVGFSIEVGRLEDAERHIAAIDDARRARGEPAVAAFAKLDGFRAQIALVRGDSRRAEQLARAANTALAEVGAPDADRCGVAAVLAEALIAQRRWKDVRVVLDEATTRCAGLPGYVALVDLLAARLELGEGHRDRATELALRARAGLDRFPGRQRIHRQLAALLNDLGVPPR